MKAINSILFVLFLLPVLGQTYEVNGTIDLVSYSQGGVELMPEEYIPYPLTNFQMVVVQYNGEDKKPSVVGFIKTDSTGKFTTELPVGKYGFLLTHDKRTFKPGQYLPSSIGGNTANGILEIDINEGYIHQDYWLLSSNGPFEVIPDSSNTVNITHYDVSICYLCP